MSQLEADPHNYRKVGYSMILVAGSLAAIAIVYLIMGPDVLYGDNIQRAKTAHFEECEKNEFVTSDCKRYLEPGNTYLDPENETESTADESPSVAAVVTETVKISMGSGSPGCEETNSCYIPYEVSISTGSTVTWINIDNAAHTVTSGTPSGGPDGLFDSSIIAMNSEFSYTFSESGMYDYFCIVHPWMTGIVSV
jgi:plastocyanin